MRARPEFRWVATLASLGLHGAALAALMTMGTSVPPVTEPPALAVEWVSLPKVVSEPSPSVRSAAAPAAAPAKVRSKPAVTRRPAAEASSSSARTQAADVPQPKDFGEGSALSGADRGNGDAHPGPIATTPGYRLGDARTPVPDYPWSAWRRGVEGRVVVRLHVDAQGNPVEAEVLHSSGDAALDRAALTALRQWRLHPATANGQPVDGQVVVPILFKLT